MKTFAVIFTYPDGHTEEIEEIFSELKAAIAHGTNLLNQVRHTEATKKAGVFGEKSGEPSFAVVQVTDHKKKIVYTSF